MLATCAASETRKYIRGPSWRGESPGYFLPGLKMNGKAAFVGLSAVGKRKRANCRRMQPSTRAFPSVELCTCEADTSPPGVTPKLTVTPPERFGSRAEAAS